SGAVLDGKLFTGFNYAGMEAGHMVIRRGGRPCTCGRRGCWETYASATGLIRSTREAMEAHPDSALWKLASTLEAVNGRTAFDAAQAGDAAARQVVEEYEADLACGLANLINILQPEVLCLGGGVSRQGENLLAPVRALLDQEEFTRDAGRRTKVCEARLGNNAGIIGGALVPLYR
ncbi:MAG: ROK family protein, partial [Clostridiales bacterium]|nr:ROK family protein [Clostridiales bacterium]